jgi:ADP-L-glycero-D-manno-heptose 6-epimerase
LSGSELSMIAITGAAGFIGSCLAMNLWEEGHKNLLLIDDFSKEPKRANFKGLEGAQFVDREAFLSNYASFNIEVIYHLGARTDTTEFDSKIFDRLNVAYSKSIWAMAIELNCPLIYASSAATYGNAEDGFSDDPSKINRLQPLNPYGQSKHDFDLWALTQKQCPLVWVGCKFFNVFGPNEYHKARMASVVFHTFHQIQETGAMNLFESHRPDFENGGQSRDFIYVKDVISVLKFWHKKNDPNFNGIYNLGTGVARSFNDLASATFHALGLDPVIRFIPTPKDLRSTYQYYTCANMQRTIEAGYSIPFTSLEEGVSDYVCKYLLPQINY